MSERFNLVGMSRDVGGSLSRLLHWSLATFISEAARLSEGRILSILRHAGSKGSTSSLFVSKLRVRA